MTLSFMTDATNVVLVGPDGVGKSMLACNLGHRALIKGKTALLTTAGQLLGDLAALDSDSLMRWRNRHYAAPDLLLIDEVGYLSYSNRLVQRCAVVAIKGESYLDALADELAAAGHGLIMLMGKGGVCNTTGAVARALGLIQRAKTEQLSTTDAAAHLAGRLKRDVSV